MIDPQPEYVVSSLDEEPLDLPPQPPGWREQVLDQLRAANHLMERMLADHVSAGTATEAAVLANTRRAVETLGRMTAGRPHPDPREAPPVPFVRVTAYAPGGEDTLDVYLNPAHVGHVAPCPHDRFGPGRWEVWFADGKMVAVGADDAGAVGRAMADPAALKRVVRVTETATGKAVFVSPDHVRLVQTLGPDGSALCLASGLRVTVSRAEADAVVRRAAPEYEVVAAAPRPPERATQ